jgi:glycosyltransferase involved in cell wall biosynthesis
VAIQDAMASGLAIISTDCGGPSTIVKPGRTGLLIPVGDTGAMAAAIDQLLSDEQNVRLMGQAGRQVAESLFASERAGLVFVEAWERAANTALAFAPT